MSRYPPTTMELREHIRRRRRRRMEQPGPATLITQRVACELSATGEHYVTIRLGADARLLGFSCECDERHGLGTARSGWRLGLKNTCGLAIDLLRHRCAGTFVQEYKLSEPSDDDDDEAIAIRLKDVWPEKVLDLLEDTFDIALKDREAHQALKPATWERPAARILAHKLGVAVGHMTFKVTVRDNRPDCVMLDGDLSVVAHDFAPVLAKYRGRGWRIEKLSAVAHLIGRRSNASSECPVCEQRFSHSGYAGTHFNSEKHAKIVEKKFLQALGSLMPKRDD